MIFMLVTEYIVVLSCLSILLTWSKNVVVTTITVTVLAQFEEYIE